MNQRGDEMTGKRLLAVSVISFLVYLLIAVFVLAQFRETGLFALFSEGISWPLQGVLGTIVGGAAAYIIAKLIERPAIRSVLDDYYIVRLVAGSRFTLFDRFQLSFFAGVGEELLFRGTLQPLLGIWLTSAIFVGLHGYFRFQKPGQLWFGAIMFALSMILGYLFEEAGLIAAMVAHMLYDLLMLGWVDRLGPMEGDRPGDPVREPAPVNPNEGE